MDDYAGRVLADRYRLPLPPSDEYELAETRAFDTYSGQEVLVRQVPLPEVVDAEVIDADGAPAPQRIPGRAPRRPTDPAVRRAIEAAQTAAQIPDHPRLDQVFDVFAEGGSLWIVSELISARPLAALLAEKPLNPYRAAEIAADVLTAVRVVHAHGWTHRNITARTVLVCDDGRVVLTGLAAGAAEEALCGYAPLPGASATPDDPPGAPGEELSGPGAARGTGLSGPGSAVPGLTGPGSAGPGLPALDSAGPEYAGRDYTRPGPAGPEPYGRTAVGPAEPGPTAGVPSSERSAVESPYGLSSGTSGAMPRPQHGTPGIPAPFDGQPALPGSSASGDIRAARAGAIAAYRAGARAAARVTEDQQRSAERTGSLPVTQGTQGQGQGQGQGTQGPQDPHGPPHAPHGAQTSQEPSEPQGSRGPGGGEPDWWAQPPSAYTGPDDDADDGEDDDPPGPTPYRAELAGTWRDGPAPWNDSAGSLPAGGSPYGTGGGLPALPPGGDTGSGAAMARRGESPYPAPGAHGGGGSGGGGGWHPSGASDALRADAQRQSPQLPPAGGHAVAGRWDDVVASGSVLAYRGPATPLAAERARQARIAVVGAVTERWAPEQAGPVHENWQLAPPIGPATDLWALGALLYRAVQGHAPYPEESAVELVQLVCAEPPAFAEECGPLRPVVESLLRQDPTERPDFEELRGWLRSLVRSAPEPEAGLDVVQVPSVDARLPIKRRRGELVRKRRGGLRGGRHRNKNKRGKERAEKGGPLAATAPVVAAEALQEAYEPRRQKEPYPYRGDRYGDDRSGGGYGDDRSGGGYGDDRRPYRVDDLDDSLGRPQRGPGGRAPRSLGRTLLVLILLLLVAAIAFAVLFMPKSDSQTPGRSVGEATPVTSGAPQSPDGAKPGASTAPGSGGTKATPAPKDSAPAAPRTTDPAVDLAKGYVLRKDPEGFRIAVGGNWERRPINESGQVRYVGGDFTLIVVPGRDSVADNGADPMEYQRSKERELQPFRDSSWSSATGLRRIDVGQQAMAEGQFTWQDTSGLEVYVRNLAVIIQDRYHVIQVIGPDGQRDRVSEMYQQATAAYRATG